MRSWSLLTALLGLFICIALSPLLSRYTFSWDGHTLHFVLLSPCVALTALAGGELAILKGIRKLGALAAISVYNVLAALVLTVPLYYFFGDTAIVPFVGVDGLGATTPNHCRVLSALSSTRLLA